MEPVHPDLIPEPGMERDAMLDMQRSIAERAVFTDQDAFSEPLDGLTVAGVDQAFTDDKAVSGVVVMEDGEVVERVSAREPLEIPYIPGLLAFREGESIAAALETVDTGVDLVLFDGSGRVHFREAGLATHMGLVFDIPAVGVAKNLLCGEPERTLDAPLNEGVRVPIRAGGGVETCPGDTVIGYAYQSRQFDSTERRHVNPLYVSPGHRVGAETAVDVVAAWCSGYKLPEPTRRADAYVDRLT